MSMHELIEGLEKAEEGSEKLDIAIERFLHPSARYFDGGYEGHNFWDGDQNGWDAPEYTTSIDAALTLVPEGWPWALNGTNVEHEMQYRADVNWGDSAWAPTAPLALCIAALKARCAA